jgi:hypothetical protein
VTEEAVLSFMKSAIRSIWPLEVLLLMQRQPTTAWTADTLVRELRASTGAIDEGLKMLIAAGLVTARDTGVYTYAPKTPVLAELVSALADLYISATKGKIAAVECAVLFTDRGGEPGRVRRSDPASQYQPVAAAFADVARGGGGPAVRFRLGNPVTETSWSISSPEW